MLHVDKVPARCEDKCCAPPPLIRPSKPAVDRHALVREAFRLEWITIGWMLVETVVAIGSGIVSGSLVLLAFGLDSVIELISAGMLMWRLSVELRHGHAFSENAERIAGRVGGALPFALAAYVAVAAGWNLWTQHHGEFSVPGFIVTLLAIPIMRHLATRKIDLANRLGSRALRTDAVESITCGWLSAVAVVSLGAQAEPGGSTVPARSRSFGFWLENGLTEQFRIRRIIAVFATLLRTWYRKATNIDDIMGFAVLF